MSSPSSPARSIQAVKGGLKIAAPRAHARAGRPTAQRSEAIHQAILDTARELFLSVGFDATSMDAVAVAAGVSKSTVYARFPTKEALMQAVVDERLMAWEAKAQQAAGPVPQDFKDRLRHIARSILDSMASEEIHDFNRMMLRNFESASYLMQALFDAGYQTAVARLTAEIEAGTRDFPVPPRNPTRVAEMLMAMLAGWYDSHRRVREISPQEAATYVDHAVDVLFAARAAW